MSPRGRNRARVAAAAALAAGLIAVSVAAGAPGDVVLVSLSTGGTKGGGPSSGPAISADGTRIAFASAATNLDPADGDALQDVYVRDLAAGTTTLVSRASGAAGAKGGAASTAPAISADGGRVAFVSSATNLDPADGDALQDVYVRDLAAGTTTLVSRATGAAGAKGGAASTAPAISADGGRVAFVSSATNLDPADADAFTDVYVRDLAAHETILVSRAAGWAKGNFGGADAAISGDGRRVAFSSQSTNLVAADTDTTQDVYVRDLQAATTTLASIGAAGDKANAAAASTSISADGGRVAFASTATNLDPADGDAVSDVFVRDLAAGTTALASRATSGVKGGGHSLAPRLSGDGQTVAFQSAAATLHPDDGDGTFDVFVRDLGGGVTELASRAAGAGGAKGDGASFAPVLSAAGGFVAFASEAANLHPGDADATSDVLRRELGPAPPPPPPPPALPPPPPPPPPPPAPPPPPPSGGSPAEPDPAPRPRAGRTEVVAPLAGAVLVRRRGQRRFVRLRAASAIPDRSEIDTSRGRVRLTVDVGGGRTASAVLSGGRAIVDQDRARRPSTTLLLSGSDGCVRRSALRERRLLVRARGGRWRTRGRYATATAVGTAWRTSDRCAATRIDARDGVLRVRDLVRRRTITLRAPRSYTARRGPQANRAAARG